MTEQLKKRLLPALLGALTLLGSGCMDQYNPPAGDFSSDSFTGRDRSKADTILKSIDTLGLEDAQKISLLNNPSYIAAYYAVNAARMSYYQSFSTYMPTVSLNGSLSGNDTKITNQHNSVQPGRTDTGTAGASLGANWLLFDGLAREFGVMAAKYGVMSQEALNDDARRKLLLLVAQSYYDILLAAENRRIALEDMSFQLKNLRETEIKHQYGAVPLSDVLNFQIQVNQADSDRLNAEFNYSKALFTLAALMGYPEGTLPDAVKFPEIKYDSDALLLSVDTYLDMALANRPDLKSYREQLKISEFNLYQTYSAFSPTFYASGSYGLTSTSNNYHGSNATSDTSYNSQAFNYGLTAEWVLFNGFQRYNRTRQAQANVAIAQFTVAETWLTVVNDVRTAYANYDLNIKQANLYSAIRKLVFEQRDLVQAEYDAGQAEIVRLNEAQRNVVSAESQLVQALANVQKARAQLEAAANINNLGRGYYAVNGASATIKVLTENGMKPTPDGLADPEDVGQFMVMEEAAEKQEAAEPVVLGSEIAGPPKQETVAEELKLDASQGQPNLQQ